MKLRKKLAAIVVGAFAMAMLVGVTGCGGNDGNGNGNGNGNGAAEVVATPTPEPATPEPATPPPTPVPLPPPPPAPVLPVGPEEPVRHLVDLPEGALLSEWSVNRPVVIGEEVGSGSTPPWNQPNWAYRFDLQPVGDENCVTWLNPEFLLYADRRGPQDQADRPFYGAFNFQAAEVPEWLIGAHFLGIAHEYRRMDRWPEPYFYFTAAVDLYAFMGMSQRMDPQNYIARETEEEGVYENWLEGWEVIFPVQFISTVNALDNRNTNFEDFGRMYDEGLLPLQVPELQSESDRVPERLYLFKQFVPAGETAVVRGASINSGGSSGFSMAFLTPEQYAERVPGGWDTLTPEDFIETRYWREVEEEAAE